MVRVTQDAIGDAAKARRDVRVWRLSLATFISVFVVNTLGFTDTITGSAMGCGRNWPLCNGQIVPSHWNQAVFIEYAHRVSVLIDMVLFLLLAISLRRHQRRRLVRFCLGLTTTGIILEAVLGALAVLFVNPPAVMAAHLGVAILSFVGTFLLVVFLRPGRSAPESAPPSSVGEPFAAMEQKVRRWSMLAVVYVYAAMYLGAYIASTGSGSMFTGWPLPAEPPQAAQGAFWLDVSHRAAALGLLALSWYLHALIRRLRAIRLDLLTASRWFVALVIVQALSGAVLIAARLAPWAFLLHVTVVSFLFAIVCTIAVAARYGTAALQKEV
ncbi:heme A synthase [Alicyclobacillus cellulosilyticus]|uniref:Heme A synthase n=1 Tax=Alicyclobacillus cellulosilyticus TaxID=1003997 RepID=A0A917KCP2_9BACL|nr:COX15/CtaA family protein [Alicyclobacillus cellulosilyticus]GGJ07034.1 heme A synthase [Alicyclobacillus cellulosilyticus]